MNTEGVSKPVKSCLHLVSNENRKKLNEKPTVIEIMLEPPGWRPKMTYSIVE